MTVRMMDTLAQVLKDAEATPEERAVLIAAVQDLDDLDELEGRALRVYLDLRARMAEGATRLPRLAAALLAAGRPAADAVLDGFDHGGCTLTFCRNGTAPGEKPIHPGPCRGWRDHLRRNAPGVARALDRIDADRREARKATSPNAQVPAGVTVGQARALDTVGRRGAAGVSPREISPQMRKNLTDAGLIETGERQGADGKMHPTLTLTPKGQGIVDARQAARNEADRRIEERAAAEGLDPVAAKLGGLAHARAQKKKREEAEVRARRAEAERGAPPNPGDSAGTDYGFESEGRNRANRMRAKLQADLLKAIGGAENVSPEHREALATNYKRYLDSYGEVRAHRRHVQAWADRLAYLNDSRDLHADPAVRADADRLINEARAGYDKAARDLADAGARAEAARDGAAEALVSVYRANGKRKTAAALKLPPVEDASPPEAQVRLSAEVDHVVRRAGGDDLDANHPDRAALTKAVGARIRQEREVADLAKAQKRNQDARSQYFFDRQRSGVRNDAELAAIDAEGDRIARELTAAKARLGERQGSERDLSNKMRQTIAEKRGEEGKNPTLPIFMDQARARLGHVDGIYRRDAERIQGLIDDEDDPEHIIRELETQIRRLDDEVRRIGTGRTVSRQRVDALRNRQVFEDAANSVTRGADPDVRDSVSSRRTAAMRSGDEVRIVNSGAENRADAGQTARVTSRDMDQVFVEYPDGRTGVLNARNLEVSRTADELEAEDVAERDRAEAAAMERVRRLRERGTGQREAGDPDFAPLDRVADAGTAGERAAAADIRARIERGDDRRRLIAELQARAAAMDAISRRTRTVDVTTRNAATRNRGIYLGIVKQLEGRVSASLDGGPPGQLLATSGRGALVAALVSMVREHLDCDEFCMNGTAPGERPIHPGPCRGWKDALRKVAPGALKIIEDERRRKLAEKRAGKTPAKKAVRRPRPKPEPEPEPEPQRLVELSPETLRLAHDVPRELPRDEAGWHAMVNRRRETGRVIEQEMDEARQQMARQQANFDKAMATARAQLRRRRPPADRRKRTMTEQEERDALTEVRFNTRLGGAAYVRASDRLKELERLEARIQAKKAAGTPLDYDEQYNDAEGPSALQADYPRDPNGIALPPEPLQRAETRVREMGQALRGDIDRALNSHPDVVAARTAADDASNEYYRDRSIDNRRAYVEADRRSQRIVQQMRRTLTLDALNQIRPTGGQRHTDVTPVTTPSTRAGRARADWEDRIAVADAHFPDDWVAASARAPLSIASSDRAFHLSEGGSWEATTNPALRSSVLAMTSEAHERQALAQGTRTPYFGGFNDAVDEVSVHEMGHRMEQEIPGLQALEFAWLRAQTTSNGQVEPLVRLREVAHSGYEAHEVAYRDALHNPYTGRSYEQPLDRDPAARPWEVFQVGLQQTYGSQSQFGPNSLTDFTLGVLATLGRTDLD